MSYVRIWLHCVWGIKRNQKLISKSLHQKLINHIREKADEKGIYIDSVNAHQDHVHCLISLSATQSISSVINQIKGESSFWINKEKLTGIKFEWSDRYFSVSVSESHVGRVRAYIQNQQEHHKKKTWEEEYHEFIRKYGFEELPA
jgi:REP element-mobilizing transposase RayT